jgi:hypothetical protein
MLHSNVFKIARINFSTLLSPNWDIAHLQRAWQNILSSDSCELLCRSLNNSHLHFWYTPCVSSQQEEHTMKKSNCMMAIGLLAVSVAIPSGRGHADVDPPGNHEQREDMRDLRQLQRPTRP